MANTVGVFTSIDIVMEWIYNCSLNGMKELPLNEWRVLGGSIPLKMFYKALVLSN